MRISDWSSDVCSADLLKDVFNLSANMCRYCGRLYGRAASRLTNDRGRALLAKYVSLLPIPGMAKDRRCTRAWSAWAAHRSTSIKPKFPHFRYLRAAMSGSLPPGKKDPTPTPVPPSPTERDL